MLVRIIRFTVDIADCRLYELPFRRPTSDVQRTRRGDGLTRTQNSSSFLSRSLDVRTLQLVFVRLPSNVVGRWVGLGWVGLGRVFAWTTEYYVLYKLTVVTAMMRNIEEKESVLLTVKRNVT